MATPRRGALHTDADNRAELQRPRLERPVTVARHAEVLTGHDPTARIDDYRRQRALVRIDPDHVARPVGREQRARRTRTGPHTPAMSAHRVPSSSRSLRDTVQAEPVDKVPVGIDVEHDQRRQTLLSGQTGSRKHRPGSTLLTQDTQRVQTIFGSDPGPAIDPNAKPSPAPGNPEFEHRDPLEVAVRPCW